MSTVTLSFKGKVLKVVSLKTGDTTIGSDPGSDLFIDSLAVQPHHATIATQGGQSVLRDLGSPDGVFVNGAKASEHTLKDNDQIRIGKHELVFEQSAQAESEADDEASFTAKRAAKQSAWLQILTGHNVGKTISLSRNLTNLGKPGVQTAVISHRNDGYFLTHLEGPKPPQVDGQDIGDKTWRLEDGNVIQMGNVKMQFTLV